MTNFPFLFPSYPLLFLLFLLLLLLLLLLLSYYYYYYYYLRNGDRDFFKIANQMQ
jgi:hypothetical protein